MLGPRCTIASRTLPFGLRHYQACSVGLVEIAGLDHSCAGISDLRKSEQFYDLVTEAFGCKQADKPIAGAPHANTSIVTR
ncbi:MAG: hypothetical protein VCE43_00335, partial [Myxococcota bacterium]